MPLETNNDFESDKENSEKVKKVVEKRQVKITDCFQTQNIEEKIYCKCPGGKTLAVKNTVSCKASHIKNYGKSYYWCPLKLYKPVGVKREEVSQSDLKKFDAACDFYLPINFTT